MEEERAERIAGTPWTESEVSAVLDVLGAQWINGYKPLAHYQDALVAAVERSLGREPGRTWPRRAASYLRERKTAIGQHEPVMIDPVLAAEVTHFLHADAQRVLQPPLGSLIHAPPHFSAWLPGGPSWLPALADTLRLEHLSELASKLT